MKPKFYTSQIETNFAYKGESLEREIEKMVCNNEPITQTIPLVYTEEKEGVLPEYDIRTDRWEIAQEAHDKITASILAERDNKPEAPENENE